MTPKPQKIIEKIATNEASSTPLLDRVNAPADLKQFSDEQLKQVAAELRDDMINVVAKTGGHLGAGLGVVELTLAIHAVFDTPADKLIWDVGHQAYPHKILTGRRDRMHTLRQGGGLSGFTKRDESEYDPFGAAHSSTSISAALGMSVARDLSKNNNHVIAVIGDGAMSAGMAYEAMNNAGALEINGKKSKLIVILNDNEMSIAPPVGAMSRYLTKLVSSNPYITARDFAKNIVGILPAPLQAAARSLDEGIRTSLGNTNATMFEQMGFYYVGPVDGHNLDHLLPVLRNARDTKHEGPILIHAITQKGKGYLPAENSADKMHGVQKFDVVTGTQTKTKAAAPSYTKVFAQSLIKEARKDDKIVAITAAMPSGTGLDLFEHEFPERSFDVGIAEQHAVTFAAGLAAEGYKPFVAIYSTFLQRAYDQVVHDVAIQNLPVRFAMDRAGLVGADGQTHAGSFDIAYLGCLPNFVLMAASDEAELALMVATAAAHDAGPIALRYPRGEGTGAEIPESLTPLEIGKSKIVYMSKCDGKSAGNSKDNGACIVSYGTRLEESLKAAKELESQGRGVTVVDARFAKPLDEAMLRGAAENHGTIITIEEGSIGGFGSFVLEFMNREGLLDNCRLRTMHLPDRFQEHNAPQKQYEEAGLTAKDILKIIG